MGFTCVSNRCEIIDRPERPHRDAAVLRALCFEFRGRYIRSFADSRAGIAIADRASDLVGTHTLSDEPALDARCASVGKILIMLGRRLLRLHIPESRL